MTKRHSVEFAPRGSIDEIEAGLSLQPKFDSDGLIPAIVTEDASGAVLMFAFMNAEALAATIETKRAHIWSRSRKRMWVKGEQSGNVLEVLDVRVDCDQDALWLRVRICGNGVACHTGAKSCFYRSIPLGVSPSAATKLTRAEIPAPTSRKS